MYVKTYKHGYKKAKFIIKSEIWNTKQKTMNKLYMRKKTPYNGLTEDLYVTGSHALLYDKIPAEKSNKMQKLIDMYNIDYPMTIDDKYKLVAYYDDNFVPVNVEGFINVYHIILDNEQSKYMNYAIYANGILAESTDEFTLTRINNYDLINAGVAPSVKTKMAVNTEINGTISSKVNKYLKQRQIEEQQRSEIIKIKSIKYKPIGYDEDKSLSQTHVIHKQKTYKNIRVTNRKKNITYRS